MSELATGGRARLMGRVGRRPIRSSGAFFVAGVSMVLSEPVSRVLPVLLFLLCFLAALALLLTGTPTWFRTRDPKRPRAPRAVQATRRRVPPEPGRQVHEIAYNCVICGRPLTNAQSMRARVGSTCIQRYGPRYKMVPNPEHERWRGLVAAAEADRVDEQARLDVEHLRAMTQYQQVADVWAAERASPAGQARREARQVGGRLMLIGVTALPVMLMGIAVTLPFF
ncbi:hypothetical protein GCM10009844_23910 [Nocardioides koreensis]|uniref:Uncharacterized protein n=1 Tax=Nocardioides koreensis TaxID=433651 RepID=A0ABN2ZT64_9ACTN